MNKEIKIKLARQVMWISGIFSLFVALLLVLNFIQLKQHKPLESATLDALVERLKDEPRNEELKVEIREFDLIVRKAYFTSRWQVKTGGILLLFGAIVFAFAFRVYTDTNRKIEEPDQSPEEEVKARIISHRWLLFTGGTVIVLALVAALFSDDYLAGYYERDLAIHAADSIDKSIEIITIVDTAATAGIPVSSDSISDVAEPGEEEQQQEAAVDKTPAPVKEKIYGIAEYKQNQANFRGLFGHGISYHKNIPTDWDGATGKNIKWKVAVTKPGFNTPVIWGDKIFISGADEEARIVSCYNRHSGKLLWEKKADNIEGSPATMPKVTDDTGLAAPTMAVDGYRVYAIFGTGDVIAFDLEGNRIWARNLGVPRNHYGHSSSLLVWNGKLIIQYDTGRGGRMLTLNVANGETVWDIQRDNTISWASPILIEVDGKMQIVTSTDPNVAGYDLETGEEVWLNAVMMGEVGPSPAYADGLVFANNEYASLVAIKAATGEVVWEGYDYLSEAASPVALDGLLYLATSYGVVVCYDALTGDQYWEHDFANDIYSSPMIAEGRLYMMDNTGIMHIIKADKSGTIISQPDLGEPSFALPAFADGRIYIRGDKSLYCIETE